MTKNQWIMMINGAAVMGIVMGIICQIANTYPWSIAIFAGSAIWLVLFLFVNYDWKYYYPRTEESSRRYYHADKHREKEKKDSGSISEVDRNIHHGGSSNCCDIQDYVKERALRSEIQEENW